MDVPSQEPGTARVAGIVIGRPGNQPIQDVTIRLTSAASALVTTSDPSGRFVFERVRSDRYVLSASRAGYAERELGAFRAGEPGTALAVEKGGDYDLTVALNPPAMITGIVREATGNLLGNVPVTARLENGDVAQRATADRMGAYRLHGLSAGTYLVGVLPDESLVDRPTPVFSPGTTDPRQATRVVVNEGEVRSGVDISSPPRGTARITGTVAWPDGSPGARAVVQLVTELDVVRRVTADARGRFVIANVDDGPYTLRVSTAARRERGAPPLVLPLTWAERSLAIAGETTTQAHLILRQGSSIAGRVRFDRAEASVQGTASLHRIGVRDIVRSGPVRDGAFTVAGVPPGRYRLRLSAEGDDRWWISTADNNGEDLLASGLQLDIDETSARLNLTLSRATAALGGFLLGSDDAPAVDFWIALVPVDRRFWYRDSPMLARTRPATDGRYSFADLPAGAYVVAVFEDTGALEWLQPTFLESLVSTGIRVTLRDGIAEEQSLRVARSRVTPSAG